MELKNIVWDLEKYEEFKKFLLLEGDEKYREFHSKLLGVKKEVIGIRTPVLKEYAKIISKGDWKGYLKYSGDEYYEESVIEGLILGYCSSMYEERIEYLNKFIENIDNWAVCDIAVANLKFLKKERERYYDFIKNCIEADNSWRIRFGVVALLDFYLIGDYIDNIFEICLRIKNEDYYVKMSQAWLISIMFIKFREKTLEYLKSQRLDSWIQNKAIQKIRESKRVSIEDKDLVLKLRINE
ncbi:DNA alkylation repair protein [Fusobacterium sp. SYSU M8A802]